MKIARSFLMWSGYILFTTALVWAQAKTATARPDLRNEKIAIDLGNTPTGQLLTADAKKRLAADGAAELITGINPCDDKRATACLRYSIVGDPRTWHEVNVLMFVPSADAKPPTISRRTQCKTLGSGDDQKAVAVGLAELFGGSPLVKESDSKNCKVILPAGA